MRLLFPVLLGAAVSGCRNTAPPDSQPLTDSTPGDTGGDGGDSGDGSGGDGGDGSGGDGGDGSGGDGGDSGDSGDGDGGDGGDGGDDTGRWDEGLEPEPGCWSYSETYDGAAPQGQRYLTDGVTGPTPTNAWWSSLVWDATGAEPYSHPLYALPLSARADAGGLAIKHIPDATVTDGGDGYEHLLRAGDFDLHVGVEGLNASATEAAGWGDFTVDARWADAEGRELIATLGQGMPFAYFRASGADAQITFADDHRVWYQEDATLAVEVGAHSYALFAPEGATWSVTDATARSDLNGADYFSVALMPSADASALASLAANAFAFPADSEVTWSLDVSKARLGLNFRVTLDRLDGGTSSRTYVSLLEHHIANAPEDEGGTPPNVGTFSSPRGTMTTVESTFSAVYLYNGVLPFLPVLGADAGRLADLIHEADDSVRVGSYYTGKDLWRLAELVPIADQIGLTSERDHFLGVIRSTLQDWFDASGDAAPLFRYDADWGAMIGEPAEFGSDTELNDHHFQWGYLISAASIAALYDPDWAADSGWGGLVKLLIRDAASPDREDSMFPHLRSFDAWSGHSYASGHANFDAGNNQESSSEAVHFANSLVFWGEATHNLTARDLGVVLGANEAAAAQQYWLRSHTFPSDYDHPSLGILWSAGGDWGTWWTDEPEAIAGINYLPVTGGSLYLARDTGALRDIAQHVMSENGGVPGREGGPDDWQDIHWMVQALYDPAGALSSFDAAGGDYVMESGETAAHTYHWITALQELGTPDLLNVGSVPTAVAFTSEGGATTYVIYNAACVEEHIAFDDGAEFTVAPRTLLTMRDGAALAESVIGTCETTGTIDCSDDGWIKGSGDGSGGGG